MTRPRKPRKPRRLKAPHFLPVFRAFLVQYEFLFLVNAKGLYEKIEAYWQDKGAEVDDDTRARVRAKLDAIESQGVTARNEVSRAVRC